MSLFKLDPRSIADRARAGAQPPRIPTLTGSVLRGMTGFTIVSVSGFLPWVLCGDWFYRGHGGETGMYAACALVFMVFSGLFLHRLIIGPGTLVRFSIFCIAFAAYSAAWIAGWMGLRGHHMHIRSAAGLLAGNAVLGLSIAFVFNAFAQLWKIVIALFVLNSLGYFLGGMLEGAIAQPMLAQASWGACYGIGFGAGLGCAFYAAQSKARAMLPASS